MLNKFSKIINNKYSKFFRFIFYLRYLLLIFLISLSVFLILPHFFNYEKKADIIKESLMKNYNLEIENKKKIEFKAFPIPRLELKEVKINNKNFSQEFYVKNLKIFPKFVSLYNFENLQLNKIILENSNISLETSDLQIFIKKVLNQEKQFSIDKLNLKILNNNKFMMRIKKIRFSNYGYNKNIIMGEVFNKKFKTVIDNNFKNLHFKILNSGVSTDISLNQNNKDIFRGVLKSKILNTNLKFNFVYSNQQLNIYNSNFRNKNLTFKNESVINFIPFFEIDSKFYIENINIELLKKLNFNRILNSKEILKKINSKNEIRFVATKFGSKLIDEFDLKANLAYGSLNYSKKILISKNISLCNGNINFLEEYPILFFDCNIEINQKEKFLKKFSISNKKKEENLKLQVKGGLNILNKKINLKNISMNNDYEASKEDLIYFKNTFESIFFSKSFVDLFDLKKIRNFILEVS